MTVRAKFQCLEIKHHHTVDPAAVQVEVRLTAVYGKEGDNAAWSKYTPSGQITMTITNPAAAAAFDLGKNYYIDFTPAD